MKKENKPSAQFINELGKQGIFEAIGDGINIQDTDFKILYQNKISKDIFGDHIGDYCYKSFVSIDHVCEGCPVDLVFKDGKIHTKERSLPANNGTSYFEITASPLRDSKGEILAGIEVVRNITERKHAQEKLKESEERYRQLSEATFEGIIFHDKGKILEVNQNFATMFGYDISELIGMNGFELFAPESRDSAIKKIISGYEKPYEAIGIKKDGSTFHMAIRGKSIHYQGCIARVATVRDITEQKQAEAKLREGAQELEEFYAMSIGRELKMKHLKEEIEELKSEFLQYKKNNRGE